MVRRFRKTCQTAKGSSCGCKGMPSGSAIAASMSSLIGRSFFNASCVVLQSSVPTAKNPRQPLYFTILYYTMLYYSILYSTLLCYTMLYHTIPYHTIPYHTIRYDTMRCDAILYYTILYYTILYYTILYYTILYYTVLLYYTILYYTILYYAILYYTILYYTVLYYTILYYTILYYTIPYCLILCHTILSILCYTVFMTARRSTLPRSLARAMACNRWFCAHHANVESRTWEFPKIRGPKMVL